MITRIEIGYRPGVRDAAGEAVAAVLERYLKLPVDSVRTVAVYKIDAELFEGDLDRVCEALVDPVIQEVSVGRWKGGPYDFTITVGFRPGVTDNVGGTAKTTLEDVLGRPLGAGARVYTEKRYLLWAPRLSLDDTERLAAECLANPLIETITVQTRAQFESAPPDLTVPVVRGLERPSVTFVSLDGSEADLVALSNERVLSLNLEEMKTIRDHFRSQAAGRESLGLGRDPTDAELEVLAQTWSEHCKHKIFSASIQYKEAGKETERIDSLFKTYIQGATEEIAERVDFLVSVFHDNAGAVRFNDRWNLVYKVETHNSPSALDPYGGAITGIVGVNRDPFGTGRGSALLANVWGYCLGTPFYSMALPKGLLHPRRIRDGVHQGVIDGGNQSGIPYMRGFEWFDDRYLGKPLVFCGTLGLMPRKVLGKPAHIKEVKPGYKVVMVGGRIGKDGIHGATFSSQELHDDSPVQAVQIGDPITQKKMTDFLLEARDQGLYTSITDNGAGGLSSSVGEMARLSGGCELDLEKAPLKYQGLQPWEILLSEAQERMTLAVPPEKVEAFLELSRNRDVESTVLGSFTDSGRFHVRYGALEVALIDMAFLHEGCPVLKLNAEWAPPEAEPFTVRPARDLGDDLTDLLARLNVCSKEQKSRQYDHEVKGLSVVKPFVGLKNDIPADATVMLVDRDGLEGVVLSEGIHPRLSDLDTYWMAASVVDLAYRRLIAAGGAPGTAAGLDNFCWPDPVESAKTPDGRYKLGQLVRACRGLYDATRAYDLPLISGKDSMKNDTMMGDVKISIPPTLLFSVVGKIRDVRRAVTPDVKLAGDPVFVVGMTRGETGGSEYLAMKGEAERERPYLGTRPPKVEMERAAGLYRALHRAIDEGLVRSAHAPALGGLGAGLALAALGGRKGIDVDLKEIPRDGSVKDDWVALFSESNSRFIVTVDPDRREEFEAIMKGFPCSQVGRVTEEERLVIRGLGGHEIVNRDLPLLELRWKETLSKA